MHCCRAGPEVSRGWAGRGSPLLCKAGHTPLLTTINHEFFIQANDDILRGKIVSQELTSHFGATHFVKLVVVKADPLCI